MKSYDFVVPPFFLVVRLLKILFFRFSTSCVEADSLQLKLQNKSCQGKKVLILSLLLNALCIHCRGNELICYPQL